MIGGPSGSGVQILLAAPSSFFQNMFLHMHLQRRVVDETEAFEDLARAHNVFGEDVAGPTTAVLDWGIASIYRVLALISLEAPRCWSRKGGGAGSFREKELIVSEVSQRKAAQKEPFQTSPITHLSQKLLVIS